MNDAARKAKKTIGGSKENPVTSAVIPKNPNNFPRVISSCFLVTYYEECRDQVKSLLLWNTLPQRDLGKIPISRGEIRAFQEELL